MVDKNEMTTIEVPIYLKEAFEGLVDAVIKSEFPDDYKANALMFLRKDFRNWGKDEAIKEWNRPSINENIELDFSKIPAYLRDVIEEFEEAITSGSEVEYKLLRPGFQTLISSAVETEDMTDEVADAIIERYFGDVE